MVVRAHGSQGTEAVTDHPLTEILDYPNQTSLRGFENMVRERLAGHKALTKTDAHKLLDGRTSRYPPAVDRRTGAVLELFGYVDPGDGVYRRKATFKEEAKRRDD